MPNIASMRPAQKAPENESKMPNILTHRESFNEAGAKSAGKPLPCRSYSWRLGRLQ